MMLSSFFWKKSCTREMVKKLKVNRPKLLWEVLCLLLLLHRYYKLPCPGGVIYVLRTFDKISPSLMMPTPILLALPSNPMATTIISVKCFENTLNKTQKRNIVNF